ncbi:MAG: hypothetical protein ACREQ5_36420, partial [Candidatus Dormibacteria bacterium]
TGITAAPSLIRWPNTRMRYSLREAGRDLPITDGIRTSAEATVRRWTRSRYYRQMAFADLYVELRRLWSRGARGRALALAPAMIVLSPRMTMEGIRRQVQARRERIPNGDG